MMVEARVKVHDLINKEQEQEQEQQSCDDVLPASNDGPVENSASSTLDLARCQLIKKIKRENQ